LFTPVLLTSLRFPLFFHSVFPSPSPTPLSLPFATIARSHPLIFPHLPLFPSVSLSPRPCSAPLIPRFGLPCPTFPPTLP
ncbi:hypothetical protein CLOP_g13172, partial [Closterium sp. NIES-67]